MDGGMERGRERERNKRRERGDATPHLSSVFVEDCLDHGHDRGGAAAASGRGATHLTYAHRTEKVIVIGEMLPIEVQRCKGDALEGFCERNLGAATEDVCLEQVVRWRRESCASFWKQVCDEKVVGFEPCAAQCRSAASIRAIEVEHVRKGRRRKGRRTAVIGQRREHQIVISFECNVRRTEVLGVEGLSS